MKKVLILNSLYLPNIGGVENSITEMASVLSKKGYRVYIVCSDSNFVTNDSLPNYEEDKSKIIIRYSSCESYFKTFISCIKLLRELKRDNTFSLIISRGYVTTFCAWLAGFKNVNYLVPSVILIQDKEKVNPFNSFSQSIKTLFSGIIQVFSIFVSKPFVFSESMDKQVKKVSFGLVKARLVKPGINLSRFCPVDNGLRNELRDNLGIPKNKYILLCLGRFSEVKQFDLAIEVISKVSLDSKKYILLLVGSGPEKTNYERLIAEKGLSDSVKIFPSTSQPELFYNIADCFMMMSRYEAFGQVLLEATASDLPILALKNSTEVNTSVDRIYRDYPELVAISKNNTIEGICSALYSLEERKDSPEFINERKQFLDEYSWGKLVSILEESK